MSPRCDPPLSLTAGNLKIQKRLFFLLPLTNTAYILYIDNMTAKEIAERLEANGWVLDRIKGSHHTYAKEGRRSIPVPFHGNKDLGILGKRILKEAGINV